LITYLEKQIKCQIWDKLLKIKWIIHQYYSIWIILMIDFAKLLQLTMIINLKILFNSLKIKNKTNLSKRRYKEEIHFFVKKIIHNWKILAALNIWNLMDLLILASEWKIKILKYLHLLKKEWDKDKHLIINL